MKSVFYMTTSLKIGKKVHIPIKKTGEEQHVQTLQAGWQTKLMMCLPKIHKKHVWEHIV